MSVLRWTLRALLVIVLIAGVVFAGAWATTDRYGASRAMVWFEADTGDLDRFPSRPVPAGDEVVDLPAGEPLDLAAAWGIDDVDRFLEDSETTSLLIVQDGQLREERYLRGSSADELRTSFSVAKSFVSSLVALAVEDGDIGSVDDPVTTYLPELLERDERFAAITIRDLMTMSSGIRYVERSLPWSDDAQTYYGTDLRRTALSAEVAASPGERFLYNNYNPLLEGLILERATGQRVADYLAERLWQPMGAEADGSWSLDSQRSGFEKMESGVNAVARDYARFGLLFLDDGRAGERQVLPPGWVAQAFARDGSAGPDDRYGFHWWTGRFDGSPLPDGHAVAVGNLGQFVYVAPDLDLVVVRLGDDTGGVDWPARFVALTDHVSGG